MLTENLALANRYQDALVLQKQRLNLWKARQQMDGQLEKLRSQDSRFNDALTRLYENSIKLQQDIKNNNDANLSYLIEAKLLLNNQIISLTQHKIAEVDLQKKLVKADYLLQKIRT
ncbi:hypothetical protein [Legionella tunisiensis]|uniref:hypothetical protein n=1 Tax=Legionella tunisiensis TaxID=1034944 RepID=UPI0003178163|nr:hypothetical protein [Legionella tunisiensis]